MRTATLEAGLHGADERQVDQFVEHVGWVHHSSPSLSCKEWSASLALAAARVHDSCERHIHRGIAAPLIGCIGLILSSHSRLSGTLPLRDLATRRRATKTAAQRQPQFCKSHLPKAHVLRQSRGPANLPVREQLNVQIGPTAAAFDRKLGYQVAQKEPAALSLA